MKFFIAFALIATVASAAVTKPTQLSGEYAEVAEIVAAIQSPSTDPATAAALEALLLDVLGVQSPIAVGPAIVDFPLPDGGVVTAEEPTPVVQPSPAVVAPVAADSTPLVQIILNINQQESAVIPAPVDTPVIDEVYVPGPVNVVDNVVAPEPVIDPVQVVDPIIVDPVQVAVPIIPAPAVVLPDILN